MRVVISLLFSPHSSLPLPLAHLVSASDTTPPPRTSPSPQAMDADQLSDLKYAELWSRR
ncbi:hypothetical protein M407DRAFT_242956 [Tulasnella calospora MUT 4182]|uniref:Uncharacterized protein n=1 Tax=Tulasnella calospora MUT 4182 TaxID=1051891 RepID=A0A0C3QCV4_9AGAM|nr:hypothetical protein M407DRAFT_242956 [Tulasnella calospora MUT 4182]